MNKIFSKILILTFAGIFLASCDNDPDLPYPIDQVKHGVLMDVSRLEGTDTFIDAIDPNAEPDLGVEVNVVPKGDGDWSSFDLIIIYYNVVEKSFSRYVYEYDIASMPYRVNLDYTRILNAFGLERENPGDNFFVVVDIHLPLGKTLYGWTSWSGFTNTDFASWQYNGRPYSQRVTYPAACPIDPLFWEGPAEALNVSWGEIENAWISPLEEEDVPEDSYFISLGMTQAQIEAMDLVGFKIERFFLDSDDLTQPNTNSMLKVWINNNNFQVFIPDQHLGVYWNIGAALGGPDDFQEISFEELMGIEINTCTGLLKFMVKWAMIGDSGYAFSEISFEIQSLSFVSKADPEQKNNTAAKMHIQKLN
ncbi:MAG: hypothetical protein ACK4VN_03280 [Bacteroidales bacterium]